LQARLLHPPTRLGLGRLAFGDALRAEGRRLGTGPLARLIDVPQCRLEALTARSVLGVTRLRNSRAVRLAVIFRVDAGPDSLRDFWSRRGGVQRAARTPSAHAVIVTPINVVEAIVVVLSEISAGLPVHGGDNLHDLLRLV
jgi:hypothetical protein